MREMVGNQKLDQTKAPITQFLQLRFEKILSCKCRVEKVQKL